MLFVFIFITIVLILLSVKSKKTIYFQQKCIFGIGDRLLDICAILAKNPDDHVIIQWNNDKSQDRFTYDTKLIKIDGAQIVHEYVNTTGMIETKINDEKYPGTESPLTTDEVHMFRLAGKRIKPSQKIIKILPPKQSYCCVHIRGTDKIVSDDSDDISMSQDRFRQIWNDCIQYVNKNHSERWFICTDDLKLKENFINECSSNINFVNIDNPENLDNAILDIFVMANSKKIIQCTKYSTFSIISSIIGGIPLINFSTTRMGRNSVEKSWDWRPVTLTE